MKWVELISKNLEMNYGQKKKKHLYVLIPDNWSKRIILGFTAGQLKNKN